MNGGEKLWIFWFLNAQHPTSFFWSHPYTLLWGLFLPISCRCFGPSNCGTSPFVTTKPCGVLSLINHCTPSSCLQWWLRDRYVIQARLIRAFPLRIYIWMLWNNISWDFVWIFHACVYLLPHWTARPETMKDMADRGMSPEGAEMRQNVPEPLINFWHT